MVEQARRGNVVVHGLTADESEVEEIRNIIESRAVYGRASVSWLGDAKKLPYADHLANLVVVPDQSVVSQLENPIEEIVRVLCPDGVAMLADKTARALGDDRKAMVNSWRSNQRIAHVEITENDRTWVKIRKKRPAGMADWTHFRYGPEGNAVSPDTLVGVPNSVRWIADSRAWPKTHFDHIFAAASAGGRLFCVFDESPAGFQVPRQLCLIARDAYNGILLWKRPLPAKLVARAWHHGIRHDAWLVNNLVAVGDHVFVSDLGKVLKLDAATGEIIKTYEGIESRQMAVANGSLFVTGNDKATPLQCLDAETGACRWKYANNVEHFIVGDDRVFFVDLDGQTVCLDAATGQPKWRKDYKDVWEAVDRLTFRRVVSCNEDILITSGQTKSCVLQGISTSDGRHLWSFEYTDPYHNFRNSSKNAFLLDGLIWVNGENPSGISNDNSWVALEPSTGEIKKNVPYGPIISRCRPAQATQRFFFCGSFDVSDRQTGAFHRIRAARNSCGFGNMLANGLVYCFPQSCECDAFLRGYLAFTSTESNREGDAQNDHNGQRLEAGSKLGGRGSRRAETTGKHGSAGASPSRKSVLECPLAKGPAFAWAAETRAEFDPATAREASAEAWPCYRHDARRSGATQALVSSDLRNAWKARIVHADLDKRDLSFKAQTGNDPISAPVAAAGMVFIAVKDRHQVVALDAATGFERWCFTAGGRIDSAPTIYGGLCLFGSHDGWIYCLRARDGALVWRFRGAPSDRLIVVDQQLESAWPISGSVLVENGVLYAAAGRHTDLDGGLVVYAVDPWTGNVLWKTRKARKEENSFDRCHVMRMDWVENGSQTWWGRDRKNKFCYRVSYEEPASLGGLLASDGNSVYLGSWPYGPPRETKEDSEGNLMQSKNGFFDSTWNFRNWWMDRRVGGHLLSFNDERTFAIRMKGFAHRWTYKANLHEPGKQFELLAQSKDIPEEFFVLRSTMEVPADWVREIPVVGEAMALSQKNLFVAGAPDASESEGGLLLAYSAETGERLTEYKLDAPPVFDGMAATAGKLFLSTREGTLLCFSAKEN